VFWPDLVSVHYAKDTLARIEELKIEYVPRDENSPNIPQIRLIENFWANLKERYTETILLLKNVKCLIAKTRKKLKSINTTGIHKTMN
jgi:hypothetical protein